MCKYNDENYWDKIIEAVQKMFRGETDVEMEEMEMNFDPPEDTSDEDMKPIETNTDKESDNMSYPGKQYKGIDVSSWQDTINWREVKKSGIDFAILRITERDGIDEQFKRNATRCEVRDIPYGVYKFSYALTAEEAKVEAKDVVKALEGRKLQYPVFLDLEWSEQKKLGSAMIEKIALAFLNYVEKKGYKVGIYCNVDWYKNVLTNKLKQYDLWLASYPAEDDGSIQERLRPPVGIAWQYSSAGHVPGIKGKVDMDVFYKNYEDDVDEKPAKKKTKNEAKKEQKEEAKPVVKTGITAQDPLNVMRGWLGMSRAAQTHRPIIDLYNSHTPRARGYAVSYYDDYCDTTVSAVFIKLGAVDMIGGTECGVEEHVKLFKAKGIWQEDGTVTPKPGWIIVYNWDFSGGDATGNDGYSDHIGFVEDVKNGKIYTIEGNTNGGIVGRNIIPVGYKFIRGFAVPAYDNDPIGKIPTEDSDAVGKNDESIGGISRERKFVGKANKATAVREWAGLKYDTIKSYPSLAKGDLVDVCGEEDGWYYVRIADKFYGFVDKQYIDRV